MCFQNSFWTKSMAESGEGKIIKMDGAWFDESLTFHTR